MIPEGWLAVGILDVAEIASGQVDPREVPYRDWPLVAPNHIQEGTGRLLHAPSAAEQGAISGKYVFSPGDVLYSKIRPYLRKVALPQFSGLCSADMYPLRSSGRLDPGFLFALLLSKDFTDFATSVSMRTGIPKINREELAKFQCCLPPLSEQKKIAAILSSVDAAIEATEAVIEQLQVAKKAMMAELFTRGIPGRHKKFKMTEIGEVPEEWEVAPLSRLARLGSGGTPSRQRAEFWNGRIPWVKTGEINYCVINETDEAISELGMQNSAAKLYPPGTLLMAMYGQGTTRGRVSLLGVSATVNQACLAIVPTELVTASFLFQVFTHHYEALRTLGHEGTQKNLNAKLVGDVRIPVPSVEEQETITGLLEDVDARRMAETAMAETLKHVKSSLMSVLLTGEVRVRPDEDAA